MVRGKYGDISEISVAKFMNLFDKYRDLRTQAIQEYRENEHLQYKGMGDANRICREDPLAEHFSRMSGAFSELRETIS